MGERPLRGIAAIILAAGGASRFGAPKLLRALPGRPDTPLLLAVLETARAAGPDLILVVIGAEAAALRAALAGQSVDIVENPRWAEGLSTSLQAGLARLPAQIEAALFMLADQPLVRPATLCALGQTYRAAGAAIVAPTFEGRRGNPILFDRRAFAALGRIRGDQGGRSLLRGAEFTVVEAPVEDAGILLDVDTPADLQALGQAGDAPTKQTKYTKGDHARMKHDQTLAALRGVRGWLIDLDGVIYRGETLVPGAAEFIALLRATRTPFLFVTNNSSRTPEQYVRRLTGMGIPTELSEIYTSALATAEYLRRQAEPGAPVAMIGSDGVRVALQEAGFRIVDDPLQARFCVVGYNPQLTYADLVRAHAAIRAGARFIGTNPDPTLPMEEGRLVPGNGAILAALATASGVAPLIIGKPQRTIQDLALARLGMAAGECAVLGDRIDTDIAGGKNAGQLTVLILTGSTPADAVAGADPQPDIVARDHAELMALWRAR